MRVIHFISSFAAGGAEVYVKNLAIGHKHSGGEPCVYGLDAAPAADPPRQDFQRRFRDELAANGIAHGIVGGRARRDPIWAHRRFRDIIATVAPDIVHAHLTTAALHACLAGGGRPLVFTHHSTPVRSPLAHKLVLRNRVARYIAVSASGKDALLHQANVPAAQISLIYNGVDLDVYTPQRRHAETDRLVIIAVGNLRPEKDYALLLVAMAVVAAACRREGRAIPLLQIVGDGALRASLQAQCQALNLVDHVRFLGVRNDVPRLLGAADLFAMSSAWEGLSVALLEALAAGLPIVATDVGGNREIVEHGVCGFLTRPRDAEDLADKLLRLLRDHELRSRFAAQARARAPQFSLARAIEGHLAVYRTLAAPSSA
ncbi:MAG: glycosyltransferase [Candidatus Krumholzibacteria bacterium]|jgi:glycosyltransferase involved in cell wall biosynthesis|nr:glycosyltransferase [Candidatus Krumholzibacteria bacterium]